MSAPSTSATRIEKDSLGDVPVPADHLWGAQTERSRQNFRIGNEKMPPALIEAFAILKLCAARANGELGVLKPELAHAIEQAATEVIEGRQEFLEELVSRLNAITTPRPESPELDADATLPLRWHRGSGGQGASS